MNVKAFVALVAGITLMQSAEGQPVPGGLPGVEARLAALELAMKSLESQVGTLKDQAGALQQSQIAPIQSQVSALQNGSRTLQSALSTEIGQRRDGDDVLEAALGREIAAREAADAGIQTAIAASSRGYSTYKFGAELVEGADATIGSIGPLPAGSYAVVATASVFNFNNNADWDCRLVQNDTGAVVGRTFAGTVSIPFLETAYHSNEGTTVGHVTIPALVTLPENGSVHMTCATGVAGSGTGDIQIVATSVGSATQGCGGNLSCQ